MLFLFSGTTTLGGVVVKSILIKMRYYQLAEFVFAPWHTNNNFLQKNKIARAFLLVNCQFGNQISGLIKHLDFFHRNNAKQKTYGNNIMGGLKQKTEPLFQFL